MVDTQEALEGQYLTSDVVESSRTKRIVVLDEGEYRETKFGKKLYLLVEIDGKKKDWRPNRDSIINMNRAFGKNTQTWVGQVAVVRVVTLNGQDRIVAEPIVKEYSGVKVATSGPETDEELVY